MTTRIEIQALRLWDKMRAQHKPLNFSLEVTARCNLDCRHCYINLPAGDQAAKQAELSLDEIIEIARQAADLGAVWCLISGGEPLLRPDFPEIYLALKRLGLLVTVFTNATLIREEHIQLFKQYPPRDIEVTLYGSSPEVYERVTRRPGSFAAFQHGLTALFDAGVRVRLKAMALQSNLEDIEAIAAFGRQYTKDYYRFDPVLHLRYDGDMARNQEIRSERLTPEQVVALEASDPARTGALEKECDHFIIEGFAKVKDDHLFLCKAGLSSFNVGYDGTFRLCESLFAHGTTVNLRQVSVKEAYDDLVPRAHALRSQNPTFLTTCRICPIVNLCLHCPAHAHLESGEMDGETPYFCAVAHARADALKSSLAAKKKTP